LPVPSYGPVYYIKKTLNDFLLLNVYSKLLMPIKSEILKKVIS